jgi:hypothetical protein
MFTPAWVTINAMLMFNIPTLTLAAATFSAPHVHLDKGTFVGVRNGTVSKFLGIPFAKPP